MTFSARAAVLLAVAAAGCTTTVAGIPSTEVPMTTPLAQRPLIDTAVETYDQMQVEIREAVRRVRPDTIWRDDIERPKSGCQRGGNRVALTNWTADGAINGVEWEAVLDAVTRVVGRYGFGPIGNFPAQGTNKTVIFDGPYGATLQYGNDLATVLSVTTGCHPD